MKTFHCNKCYQQVFFENVHCEKCDSMLGYQPEHQTVSAFEPAEPDRWTSLNPVNAGMLYKQCANYSKEHVCNWMLPADSKSSLCASCQLTRIIPALSYGRNRLFWNRLETAKRRLLYTLWDLHLQPSSKAEDPLTGLAFEFLEDTPDKKVMTGHARGLITLNIAEADAAHRERTREQMGEPYRTLLGHFRHESGHYYFDRLIAGSPWIEPFRELFGDERQNYREAMQQHYSDGPPPDWGQHFITSYASSHPWEDWAESWAHYLQMIDTLDTAFACGVIVKPKKANEPEVSIEARPLRVKSFADVITDWFNLTNVLNNLNRSAGMPDPYPFALSSHSIKKLEFIHSLVLEKKAVPLVKTSVGNTRF